MLRAMEILGQGMGVQRQRLEIASTNLANAHTTRTADGGAYRRKELVVASSPLELRDGFSRTLEGVRVSNVAQDPTPQPRVFDPGHPDADADGMVTMPNVEVVEEMVDITSATRSFEANVTAFEALKQMVNKSMELGR